MSSKQTVRVDVYCPRVSCDFTELVLGVESGAWVPDTSHIVWMAASACCPQCGVMMQPTTASLERLHAYVKEMKG